MFDPKAYEAVRATFPEAGDGRRFASWMGPAVGDVHRIEFPLPGSAGTPRILSLPPGDAAVGEIDSEPPPVVHGPPMPPAELRAAVDALEGRAAALADAARALATAREDVIAGAESAVLQIAVALAESLLDQALEADPTLHGRLAQRALESLDAPAGEARLRASREAYAAITDVYGEPSVPWANGRVPVVLDPSLDGLGCVAETEDAKSDGRLPALLDAARRALLEERRRQVDDPEDAG